MTQILRIVSIVCFVMAGLALVMAVYLFRKNDITGMMRDAKKRKKALEEIPQYTHEQVAVPIYDEPSIRSNTAKIHSVVGNTEPIEATEILEETEILEATTILDEATTILSDVDEATTILSQDTAFDVEINVSDTEDVIE